MPAIRPAQGNRLSILALILPIVALVVVFGGAGVHLPVNQVAYLGWSAGASCVAFLLMWWLGFRGVRMDGTLWMVALVLGLLWLIAGIPFTAWLNQTGDASASTTEYRKIVRKHYSSGGGFHGQAKSSPSCTIWTDTPVAGSETVVLRADYCELIGAENDGVLLTMKQGNFNMPWLQDYSLIRHYDEYRQRLGV